MKDILINEVPLILIFDEFHVVKIVETDQGITV